jgi:hypothetical protein
MSEPMIDDLMELRERIQRCKFLLGCIGDPHVRSQLRRMIRADESRLERIEPPLVLARSGPSPAATRDAR